MQKPATFLRLSTSLLHRRICTSISHTIIFCFHYSSITATLYPFFSDCQKADLKYTCNNFVLLGLFSPCPKLPRPFKKSLHNCTPVLSPYSARELVKQSSNFSPFFTVSWKASWNSEWTIKLDCMMFGLSESSNNSINDSAVNPASAEQFKRASNSMPFRLKRSLARVASAESSQISFPESSGVSYSFSLLHYAYFINCSMALQVFQFHYFCQSQHSCLLF